MVMNSDATWEALDYKLCQQLYFCNVDRLQSADETLHNLPLPRLVRLWVSIDPRPIEQIGTAVWSPLLDF